MVSQSLPVIRRDDDDRVSQQVVGLQVTNQLAHPRVEIAQAPVIECSLELQVLIRHGSCADEQLLPVLVHGGEAPRRHSRRHEATLILEGGRIGHVAVHVVHEHEERLLAAPAVLQPVHEKVVVAGRTLARAFPPVAWQETQPVDMRPQPDASKRPLDGPSPGSLPARRLRWGLLPRFFERVEPVGQAVGHVDVRVLRDAGGLVSQITKLGGQRRRARRKGVVAVDDTVLGREQSGEQ